MKLKPVLIAVLCVLILGGSGFYWYWLRTPQYSMFALATAVHKHDPVSFKKYFDTDAVASNAIDDLSADPLREAGGPKILRHFLGITATAAGLFKPQMVEALSKSINNYIAKTPQQNSNGQSGNEQSANGQAVDDQNNDGQVAGGQASGTESAQDQLQDTPPSSRRDRPFRRLVAGFLHKIVEAIKPPPLREVLRNMGFSKENYKGLTGFEDNGQTCHVGLIFQAPQNNDKLTVMLELQNADDHWHVTRISNIDALARNLTASTSP